MNDTENAHTIETAWSRKCYWGPHGEGNYSACGPKDNPSRVDLTPIDRSYPELAFDMPRQRYELEKVDRLMQFAYEHGRNDQMRTIRETLKTILGI